MNTHTWVTCIHKNERARLRLLCLPYAAGSASIYRFLACVVPGSLLEDLEIWAAEYPGHGERSTEAPYRDFDQLCAELADGVRFLFGQETALFGCSLGAILGFEVARRLRDRTGENPAALLVAACEAPQLTSACTDATSSPAALAALLGPQGGAGVGVDEIARRWTWFQSVFGLRATYRYTQGPPLSCPITAFGGADDSEVSEANLRGWQEQTTLIGSFAYHLLPGQRHLFLREAPFLRLLSGALLATVERAQMQPV